MRYSADVPNFGDFAGPEVFAEVARRTEAAGWDALPVWDHVVQDKPHERMPWNDDLKRVELMLRRIDQGPPR